MKTINNFVKKNPFLSIVFIVLFIVVAIILICLKKFFNNNSVSNIELSGYYYENVEKNSFSQDTYYFENDGACFIKHNSVTNDLSTLFLDENYTLCSYNVEKGNLTINTYDINEPSELVDTKTYTIERIDDGIKLNDVEFLNQNYENIPDFQENFIENHSLLCASKVAKKLGVSNYCTTWEKVSDGFYNYSCGINIRTIVDDTGISYDTYNNKSGQFSTKNYCYKIIKNNEKEVNISNATVNIILSDKDIYFTNLNNSLIASMVEPLGQIKITINIADKTLNEIEKVKILNKIKNVKVKVDLSKYTTPGIYETDLVLNIDEFIYDYTIEPLSIKIKIFEKR